MGRRGPLLVSALFGLAAVAAPIGQTADVGPLSISLRVFEGDRFVDDLSLADLEVLEDGVAVRPEGLALVRKGAVVRREGPESFVPKASRTFYIMFQTVDWDPALGNAIDHLFSSVLRPGDAMTLITPVKSYALHRDALAKQTPARLSKSMQGILQKDIQRGGGQYRDLTRDLVRLTRAIGGLRSGTTNDIEEGGDTEADMGFGLEQRIDQYRNTLMTFESLRLVDERKLLAFAESVRTLPGQKIVYLFYAREYRPEISPSSLQALMSLYQDNPTILANLMELFQLYKHESRFDAAPIKKAFVDAGVVFHFIFMEKKTQRVFGAHMREQSEDVYPGFREIALATKGFMETSQNAASSFARASAQSDDFYVLTYAPTPGASWGAAGRSVSVSVKRPQTAYTVVHSRGYAAR